MTYVPCPRCVDLDALGGLGGGGCALCSRSPHDNQVPEACAIEYRLLVGVIVYQLDVLTPHGDKGGYDEAFDLNSKYLKESRTNG